MNYFLYQLGKSSGKHAVIFLHGFPAESFNNTDLEKNMDIANNFYKENNTVSIFLPHYKGLGRSNGSKFSFVESLRSTKELVYKICKNFDSVSFFGHSFGGFIALNCLAEMSVSKINKVFLHAPLYFIPDRESLKKTFLNISKDSPSIVNEKNLEQFLDELAYLESIKPSTAVIAKKLKGNMLITQSINDFEVPELLTSKLANELDLSKNYKVVDSDHAISINRSELSSLASNWILNG